MTITEVPTRGDEPADVEVLFEEARQRRKRRRLVTGSIVVAVLGVAMVVGLLATRSGGGSPRPVTTAPDAPVSAAGAAGSGFSIRPVLCYAPPLAVPAGEAASTGPLPTCAPSSQLTATNLQVAPEGNSINGYTSNTAIGADPRFATYPSTPSSGMAADQDVLLPGTPTVGSTRFVLGPAGLDRGAISYAQAVQKYGQWMVDLTLTPRGSVQWDTLARLSFHAVLGVVVDGQVVSAPLTEPTQSSFQSFDGRLQIAGEFSQHQAEVIASGL